jgi:hypothetical protein
LEGMGETGFPFVNEVVGEDEPMHQYCAAVVRKVGTGDIPVLIEGHGVHIMHTSLDADPHTTGLFKFYVNLTGSMSHSPFLLPLLTWAELLLAVVALRDIYSLLDTRE